MDRHNACARRIEQGRFDPQGLATLAWAFATLPYVHADLLRLVAGSAMAKVVAVVGVEPMVH